LNVLKDVRGRFRSIVYRGRDRECPICGTRSRIFRTVGRPPRHDAQCPRCSALERHRLIWLFLRDRTNLFDGARKRVLHVAPERCFEPRLRARLGEGYVTGDLRRAAMVRLDVTDLQYPDESFDVVLCSHVLEHVPEDRRAMRELYRVTKRGGWVLILVPIHGDSTVEDATIVDRAERLKVYGHDDHVRSPGLDYADRLRDAGFDVAVVRGGDVVAPADTVRLGVTPMEVLFHCRRAAPLSAARS
jgi:SAM-dependent methyltransferase